MTVESEGRGFIFPDNNDGIVASLVLNVLKLSRAADEGRYSSILHSNVSSILQMYPEKKEQARRLYICVKSRYEIVLAADALVSMRKGS